MPKRTKMRTWWPSTSTGHIHWDIHTQNTITEVDVAAVVDEEDDGAVAIGDGGGGGGLDVKKGGDRDVTNARCENTSCSMWLANYTAIWSRFWCFSMASHCHHILWNKERERERKKERTNSIQQTTIIAKDDDDDGHYSSSGDADGDPMRPTLLPSTRNNHSKQRTHRARTLEHIEHYTMSYDTK